MTARLAPIAVIAAFAAVPRAAAAPAHDDTFDILYLSEARPVVVRLHLATDGKPPAESWGRFADGLFTALDADKNGSADAKELKRLNAMLSLVTGTSTRLPMQTQPMTRTELGDFLRKNGFGTLRVPVQNQQRVSRGFRRGGIAPPEEADKILLEVLDANKDGKLSASELAAAPALLARLDADENELLTLEELLQRPQSPFFVSDFDDGRRQQPNPGVELLALNSKGADANLALRVVSRYGPRPSGGGQPGMPVPVATTGFGPPPPPQSMPTVRRLGKKELKLSDEAFNALDVDGDGELDMEELARFGRNATPELEIGIRLGKVPAGTKGAEVIRAGQSPVKAYPGLRAAEVVVEVPGVRLDLIAPPILTGENFRSAFRNRHLNRIQELDRDGNSYLDRDEVAIDPVISEHFTALDRDGDGKIFDTEVAAAVDELQDVAAAALQGTVTIELNEMGRGLFGLIDADGDNRLSVRELRAMPELVERFDANKDGGLATTEVPRRFEASFAAGLGSGRGTPQFTRFGLPAPVQRPQTGPMWFQKMDRNRDGDVSRREFVGTNEHFRKMDADGDGLISLAEAEAADK